MRTSRKFVCGSLLAALLLAGCGGSVSAAAGGDGAAADVPLESWFGSISSAVPSDEAALADGRTVALFFGDVQPEASISEYAEVGALIDAAREDAPEADFAMQCGDITNTGGAGTPEEWGAFFAAAAPALEGLPTFFAPGNHECVPTADGVGGKPETYLKAFDLPANGPAGYEEEYYSFDCGDLHVVSLSSNYLDPSEDYAADEDENARIAGEIDAWIEADLAGADRPWKIVLMHQPAYAVAGDSTAAAMRARWVPIFDRTGVDLVLCGHQHEMMRTFPLKDGVDDPQGLVEVMGNASQKNYETSGTVPPDFIAFEMGGISGWHKITATAETLRIEAFAADGRLLDAWEK
ncbi:MAG: metallophosphoesterase [Clostridiales Family XIII bacterium]|jgi:3',5'-cyclic AMP phosphodiesterase CpdA|nr:metallophosphoesterase [Clostridiales Family XIII bacterium]